MVTIYGLHEHDVFQTEDYEPKIMKFLVLHRHDCFLYYQCPCLGIFVVCLVLLLLKFFINNLFLLFIRLCVSIGCHNRIKMTYSGCTGKTYTHMRRNFLLDNTYFIHSHQLIYMFSF